MANARPRSRPAPPEPAAPSFVESLLDTLVASLPEAEVEASRARFEARTGAFTSADAFHEERIRAFTDELVCETVGPDGLTPAERARRALTRDDSSEPARWLAALTRAERSLFRAELEPDGMRLRCLLGGARYRVVLEGPSARLRSGDVLDGRIAPVGREIHVLPGMVFHPEEAHEALVDLVAEAVAQGRERRALLDGLLRIRMRHDRFVSIHARHLYRVESLDTREIKAAPWKR
ncbi:MAG: hypothetical protein OHK0013_06260 [Sandaracinaceae bacterium]